VSLPPILDNKRHDAPSVFEPVALLREARRQKSLAITDVPGLCVLDPDGDILRRLKQMGAATRMETWPCYHTDLYSFPLAGRICGIVARAVGAPFAVLVAEELFACGCEFLMSVTSAGQITPAGTPPYFVIIDRALRDEGTSYHYAAPRNLLPRQRQPWTRQLSAPMSVRVGRRMHLFGRRPKQLKQHVRKAYSPSKWRRRPFTHLPRSGTRKSCAWHRSPIQWVSPTRTLKREKRRERIMRCMSWKCSRAICIDSYDFG
jgi:hypothetical protein